MLLPDQAALIVSTWLNTAFAGGRHQSRLKIEQIGATVPQEHNCCRGRRLQLCCNPAMNTDSLENLVRVVSEDLPQPELRAQPVAAWPVHGVPRPVAGIAPRK
jgi:hypothetical protein